MKLGTVTFHRAVNYGAVLQTYALQRIINEKGQECEVIDYQCEAFRDSYKVIKINFQSLKGCISSILQIPFKYLKNKKFKRFIIEKINISNEKYTLNTISNANDRYEKFIVGSDQVWNCNLTNFDKTYFLDFVNDDKKKNSYAASFGFSDVPKEKMKDYKELLKNYNLLSVREHTGKEIVNKLTNKESTITLDPVLLLSSKQWEEVMKKPKMTEKYILVYYLNDTSVFRYADKLSKVTGYNVVCIQNSIKRPIKAKYVNTSGPEEFLGLFMEAEYVITDSFHGTAFSIIFKKQFWTLLNTSKENKNSRITSLLKQLNLEERILSDLKELDLNLKVNYNDVSVNLNSAINRSEEFLNRILE